MNPTVDKKTILNAAKAAGLCVHEEDLDLVVIHPNGEEDLFNPKEQDADNALIQDGAEIAVSYWHGLKETWVHATSKDKNLNFDISHKSKAQARRDAVLICAAAQFEAATQEARRRMEAGEQMEVKTA